MTFLRNLSVGLPDRQIRQSGVDAQFTRDFASICSRGVVCRLWKLKLSKFKRARFRPAPPLVHLIPPPPCILIGTIATFGRTHAVAPHHATTVLHPLHAHLCAHASVPSTRSDRARSTSGDEVKFRKRNLQKRLPYHSKPVSRWCAGVWGGSSR